MVGRLVPAYVGQVLLISCLAPLAMSFGCNKSGPLIIAQRIGGMAPKATFAWPLGHCNHSRSGLSLEPQTSGWPGRLLRVRHLRRTGGTQQGGE
eukprot:9444663-Pyramimonas_sp.AAC.1